MTLAADLAAIYADLLEAGLMTETVEVTTDGVAKECIAIIRYGQGDDYKGSEGYGTRATMRIQAQGDNGIEAVTKKTTITIGSDTWRVIGADRSTTGREWIIQANKVGG